MTSADTMLTGLLNYSAGGVGVGVGILMARELGRGIGWLLMFITGRQDKREKDADDATTAAIKFLREELERVTGRLAVVERDLEECKKHRDELTEERNGIAKERAELQGLLAGLGNANQHAQLIIAAEKVGEIIGRDEAEGGSK